jgi:hypothetical protein
MLNLFLAHRSLSPWWRRRYVPLKRLILQEPHGVIFQKTLFFFWDCILVRHPPCRENGSVIYLYNCYWALAAPSLSSPRSAELQIISSCLIWDWVRFLSLITNRGATVEYSNPLQHGPKSRIPSRGHNNVRQWSQLLQQIQRGTAEMSSLRITFLGHLKRNTRGHSKQASKLTAACLIVLSQSHSYLPMDCHSDSLSWHQATIWDMRPVFLPLPRKLSANIFGSLLSDSLSDERTGL